MQIKAKRRLGVLLDKLANKLLEDCERGSFRHQIRKVITSWDVFQFDLAGVQLRAHEFISKVDVLRRTMVDRVLREGDSGLVVNVDGCRFVVLDTKLIKEVV
jgi:hypothetical protein